MKIYSHYSYNVDSGEEHSDDSDDSDEVNSHEKIQTKNIEYIYIFFKKKQEEYNYHFF